MKSDSFTFTAKGDVDIFVHRWQPEKDIDTKAVVQIAHGMAEHSARYENFANALVNEGYTVYANDHRGHGKTAGSIENMGYWADQDGWDLVVGDMVQLTRTLKDTHPGLPVFLFGHSMGSFLSRDYISAHGTEINGVILSGTAGDAGLLGSVGILVAKLQCMIKGKKAQSPLLDKLSFGSFNNAFKPNRTDFDWLSRDDEEVDKYVNDPFCGAVFTCGFFSDLLQGLKKINVQRNIDATPGALPMYLMAGDKDPVGNNGKGVLEIYKVYEKAGIRDISYKLYEDGRHEMLNEINKEEVFKDIAGWLNSRITLNQRA